jgi:RecB family endonuclease NucS
MYCESCHERIKTGTGRCPNCGQAAKGNKDLGSGSVRDTANPTAYSLPPAPKLVEEDSKVVETKPNEKKNQTRPTARKTSSAVRPAPAPSSAEPNFDISPDGIRDLLIARPELIEEGLRVHTDADDAAAGASFETSVGKIDLLARDAAAGWVVVLVAESGQGKELVGDLLQLMGWVRKHLSAEGQEIRAVVLVDSVPEDLGYAAAAISDSVEFKLYRVGMTLEKVDL